MIKYGVCCRVIQIVAVRRKDDVLTVIRNPNAAVIGVNRFVYARKGVGLVVVSIRNGQHGDNAFIFRIVYAKLTKEEVFEDCTRALVVENVRFG